MKVKITIFFLLLVVLQVSAGVHFVSKTGSSVPPFTTWTTASDSIQKAINISSYGDTVYVGNGVYREWVYINNGVTLIGSGMDSCIIDTRQMDRQWATVEIKGVGNVSGFGIYSSTRGGGTGIFYAGNDTLCKFENNRIEDSDSYTIAVINSQVIIRNNFIKSKDRGIQFSGNEWDPYSIIENNYFTGGGMGIYVPFPVKALIMHNTFYYDDWTAVALTGSDHDTLLVYNNLVIAKSAQGGLCQSNRPMIRRNNVLYGRFTVSSMNLVGDYSKSQNNISINVDKGMKSNSGEIGIFKYNNSWGGKNNYMNFIPDSTNLSVDPMFVNADSLDFHLQKYSPLIDAGDPSIKDVDGTRSDIGLYGGPYGESYTYQDLAPRSPVNLTTSNDEKTIMLHWQKNTEADFSYYSVYRDTVPNFTLDSLKLIAKVKDTVYVDRLNPSKNYYYKLTATDKQGNRSQPSEETGVITGVNGKPELTIKEYQLYQNYPNPFNPSTKIGYRLSKPGNVKITVYDIKGALITILENGYRQAGYYETEFTGIRNNAPNAIERLASGIYIYSIEVKDANNTPVFTDMKKMIMVK